jgi:thiamine pyrophosphate-dependent acetolactate synthase large subunit-like protein
MISSPGPGRRRPAYLEVPLDLLSGPTDLRRERFAQVGGSPQPAPTVIERAIGLLAGAQRPLIVAGGGARTAGPPASWLRPWTATW